MVYILLSNAFVIFATLFWQRVLNLYAKIAILNYVV